MHAYGFSAAGGLIAMMGWNGSTGGGIDPIEHSGRAGEKFWQGIRSFSVNSKRFEGRSLSGRISRHLRLLREHGIIKKLPNQHKYLLTAKGRLLTTALNQLLGANISDLSKLAA